MKVVKKIFIFVFVILIYNYLNFKDSFAYSTTAAMKGYETSGLDYLSDEAIINHKIYSSANTYYGSMGLWAANYKYVTVDQNGVPIVYYVVFIEAYIDSRGENNNYFFRNKQLIIDYKTKIWSGRNGFMLINHSEGTDAAVSLSNGWSIDGALEGGISPTGPSVGVSLGASFSNNTMVSYPAVSMTVHTEDLGGWDHICFQFDFANWKKGAMISPNVGLVSQGVYLVYEAANYIGNEVWNATIEAEATIFKDGKWPRSNGTVSDKIHLTSIEGIFLETNN